jgi:adenylate kinase
VEGKNMVKRIVLLGAPGSGKGTLAQLICKDRGIPQISTGDILREAVKAGSDLGKKAKAFMEAGDLVPDEVILGMMEERLAQDDCAAGYILDGFPRNQDQAAGLDELATRVGNEVEVAAYIDVPEEEVVTRICNRRSCPKCKAIYNLVTKPPKKEGVCDFDGEPLEHRSDDTEKVVRDRYQVYLKQTSPLVDYYRAQGKLVSVHGVGTIDEVLQRLTAGLDGGTA